MQPLASREAALAARPAHHQRAPRFEVHLDARFDGVEAGDMAPVGRSEIAAEHPVQVQQQVEVEGGGHAELVVIGRLEQRAGLDQVDTDQQRPASRQLMHVAQEAQRFFRREVADARAGVEQQARAAIEHRQASRQVEAGREIQPDTGQVHLRVFQLQVQQ